MKTLTAATLDALRAHLPAGEEPPRHVITMGIGTILKAEAVLLLASGPGKARSVERMVRGALTPRLPASFLQAHRSVEIFLDADAASRL